MTIYRLAADSSTFIAIAPLDPSDWCEIEKITGNPFGASWRTLRVQSIGPKGETAAATSDYPYLASHVPVMSTRAWQKLESLLGPFAEPLALSSEERNYVALNITKIVDALDMRRTKYVRFPSDPSGILAIKTYHFDKSRVGDACIFRDRRVPLLEIYCTERFRHVVETFGLTGFIFQEVDR